MMKAVLQRVSQAHVEIDGEVVGKIGYGLLILFCAEQADTQLDADKMLAKILKLRIFSDDDGKMNRSILQLDGQDKMGELLIVSQFTLAADVRSGNRPSFTKAAPPQLGQELYEYFVGKAKESIEHVATGQFGSDMKIHLVNDGPVTIIMDSNA
ncbi:D-aminoacyl-tRNA deacylase [Neisseria sp. Ec49-e6-T10]|uniref:D-aminoacyl-tRNA deacylase n=1 Tax=Neisseria sp. Ec49-e6-T10 TaxID=3140744 RepID=UPI003EB8501E